MKLIDLNRDGGIGANSLYLEIGPFRIVIDAGMHPKYCGHRSIPEYRLIEDNSVDFVILTHCHLDHLGSLPILMRRQPRARIFSSVPSKTLAGRMLLNSCNVMKKQREELGVTELPLYLPGEVRDLEAKFSTFSFQRPRVFRSGKEEIEVTFFSAGHVAGAAGVRLNFKHRKIFITGDVLFERQKTLPGANFPDEKMDTLVTETTRGITERLPNTSRKEEVVRLILTIDQVIARGGIVLIPVFALGRMQEVLSIVDEARKRGRLRSCPIFCSGLGVDLAQFFDSISRKTGLVKFRKKVLTDLKVRSLPRNFSPDSFLPDRGLFILSSGMMVEGTPSYLLASRIIDSNRNLICFVGYCDPDTPGGKLLSTQPGDRFNFETMDYSAPVYARIEKFDLSGHADRSELLQFAQRCDPRAVVLTHGDTKAREWFADALSDLAGKIRILDATPLETYHV